MWCCSCFSKTYEAPEIFELDYRHSSLNEVPNDVFIYESTLEKLDLGCNQISDLPPSLFHCHELRELDLCDNDLSSIPSAIGSLTRLTKLDLSRNAIAEIADTVKSCKNLVYLDLSLNHLQKLPEGISQLLNLEELFLNDTYLEFLSGNFGRLTKLKVLELRENQLQTLPKSMNRLHHLQRIDLGQNDIFELPEVTGTMTNLTELWIDNNSLRSLPKFIGNLTKLNCLDASQNDIQDIADEIGKCTQLSDLTLASNSLESLPDSFPKLENLTVLRLDSNSIQYLPEDFGNLKNLQELTLIRNLLKYLPTSIGLMRKLHTIYLDDNLLTTLPKEIGSCSALTVLSVAKNRLVNIPSEVGHLTNLKVLSLSGNLLVNLPVSLLNVVKLKALWLSESQSKPLNPLNKEMDSTSGQHVLTCYLLPQLPSTQTDADIVADNDENLPPRRSRPSIKFCTDLEAPPTVIEPSINKRGLLRAPTPYPKELRALAKHASHLRSKDQNGDVIINDEPEYDGDYPYCDEETQDVKTSSSAPNGNQWNPSQPALPIKDYKEEDTTSSSSGRNLFSYRSGANTAAVPGPQTVSSKSNNIMLDQQQQQPLLHHYPTQTNISLIDPNPAVIDSTGESNAPYVKQQANLPPPYYIAAKRAAFFRSSPSSPVTSTPPQQLQSPTTLHPQLNFDHSQIIENRAITSHASQQEQFLPTSTTTDVHQQHQTMNNPLIHIPQVLNSNISGNGIEHSKILTSGRNNEESSIHNRRENCTIEQQNKIVSTTATTNNNNITTTTTTTTNHTNSTSGNVQSSTPYTTVMETTKTVTSGSSMSEALEKKFQEMSQLTLSSQQQMQQQQQTKIESVQISYQEKLGNSNVSDTKECIQGQVKGTTNLEKVDLVGNFDSKKEEIVATTTSEASSTLSITSTTNISETVDVVDSVSEYKSATVESVLSSMSGESSNKNSLHRSTSNSSHESTVSSRIPVLSPSKIPNTIHSNIVQEPIVPHPPPLSSSTFIDKDNVGNINVPTTSAATNINLSRIPKFPNANTTSNTVPENYLPKKPEIVAPKPILTKTTSGSKIPSSFSDTRINSNNNNNNNSSSIVSNKPVPPIPIEARTSNNINLNSSITKTPTSANQMTAIPSPATGSSRIPRFGETLPPLQPQQIQQQLPHHDHHTHRLERTASGSRIPKFNETSKSSSKAIVAHPQLPIADSEVTNQQETGIDSQVSSKIPTIATARTKPWIFGTHRNARVVPVEYSKIDKNLGFTITDGCTGGNGEANGVFVDSIDEGRNSNSTVKVGDKILRIDDIDVANMSIDIVRKILSNCQENIHLLVSRHY